MSQTSDNKRIAKNTFLLYFRMLLMMAISIYTSRVVLASLGIEDYGIYNVVGGIVVLLGFLNGTMSSASARFINVSLSKKNTIDTQRVFSTLFLTTIIIAIIVVIISETVGFWFLLEKIQYPRAREKSVIAVYQLSIITVATNILCIPYNSMIIANEKMKAFAYISIFDAFAKLIIALVVGLNYSFDKLIFYALLIAILQLVNNLVYASYCKFNFIESKILLCFDKKLFKNVVGYMGWSSYGSFVSVGLTQGINIILNLFYGPSVNAARGVASQVSHACMSFANNFQIAVNPQLTKSVALQDISRAKFLVKTSTRLSFYMLCIICVPLIGEAGFVLDLWLKEVPQHTVSFVRLMLVICILQSLAFSLRTANQAEGNIKKFQLVECTLLLLIVPLSFFSLQIGFPPESVLIVHLVIESISQLVRIYIVGPKIKMTFSEYLQEVYIIVLPILLLSIAVTFLICNIFPPSWMRFVLNLIVTELFLIVAILLYGVTKNERGKIIGILKSKM